MSTVRREEEKVKDPEKTETENKINRKLDALRSAVRALFIEGDYIRGELIDVLDDAWRKEEDD